MVSSNRSGEQRKQNVRIEQPKTLTKMKKEMASLGVGKIRDYRKR